jgi:hypothetical protein
LNEPEAQAPPLDLGEVHEILGRIQEVVGDPRVVVVGGQAVSVWFRQLGDRIGGSLTAARVVSRDLDLLGDAQHAKRAAELLGGGAHIATWENHTPLSGVVIFVDRRGHRRRLDVMHSVHGMRSDDLRETALELDVLLADGRRFPVWVMHPERTMESRVHNSSLPNKQTELAFRQLRASILCARAFSELLLDERAAVRDVLNLNERVFRFALRDRDARQLAVVHEIDCFGAVLADERLGPQFAERRFPQMQAQIAAVRQRDRGGPQRQAGRASDRRPPRPGRRPPQIEP